MRLEAITEDHLINIHPRLKEYAQYPYPYLRMMVRKQTAASDYSDALVDGTGKCLGIGGVISLWPGVWSSWMLLTDDISSAPKTFIRICRRYMKIADDLGIHRIQADIPAEMKDWLSLLDKMGFKNEGLMKGYTAKKEDQYRVAWTKV